MSNRSKTLYTGVSSNLRQRIFRHKNGWFQGSFTSRYKLDCLVYYEEFVTIVAAIAREKQIKGMTRLKKMQLIVGMNPTWRDLSEGWYDRA